MAAHRVSRLAYQRLAEAIRQILANAINVGGTTLRDFVGSDGQPGYFRQSLYVYGRQDEAPAGYARPQLKASDPRPAQYRLLPFLPDIFGWKTPVADQIGCLAFAQCGNHRRVHKLRDITVQG